MKYLKLYESFENIHEICKEYRIYNYTINPDGSIDVPYKNNIKGFDGRVDLQSENLTKLPLKFNKVSGYFECSYNNLTSLEGSPKEVNGDFHCSYNQLSSFQYAPIIIRGYFDCEDNNIKSFEYFPNYIGSYFYCIGNPIYYVWRLFEDITKIELLNDCDIFRDEDTDEPVIIMDRLNDFLLTIGLKQVKKVKVYKNI